MNAKKYFLKTGAVLLLLGLCFLSSVHTEAAVKKLNVMGNVKKDKKSCQLDLDGDGKKEKLTLKWKGASVAKAKLYVNGKKALTLKDPIWVDRIGVDYIKMSNSKIFIRCYTIGDSSIIGSDYFYRYDKKSKKFKKETKLLDVNENGNWTKVKSVTASEIKVRYCHNLPVVGHIVWTATYALKDGKLKQKQAASPARCLYTTKYGDSDGYGKLLEKNQYKAKYDLRFYTDGSMRTVAYDVKANEIIILKQVKYVKGKFYVRFDKDGKAGWTDLQGYGSREIFYGTAVRMNVG